MSIFDDIWKSFTGQTQRDAQNEALDRQQGSLENGYATATKAQQDAFAEQLKQLGMTDQQVQGFLQQMLASTQAGGAQSLAAMQAQNAAQVQGGKDTNAQTMKFLQDQINTRDAQNDPQLQAKKEMLAALQQRELGLANGTGTFQPTAMYQTQLAEMQRAMNNSFAARGLGNSSEAITGLREGQTKLMATDQQQQFTNVNDMYQKLMANQWNTNGVTGVNLNNPYANLGDVGTLMNNNNANVGNVYGEMAKQAGLYGTGVANAYSTHGTNMSNLATNQGVAVGNVAAAYGNVPQGGVLTGLTNAVKLGTGIYDARTSYYDSINAKNGIRKGA